MMPSITGSRYAMFFRKRFHCSVLISGHPRCGTTSAASLCQRLGVEVGDEWVGARGISSWMMAVDDRRNPYANDELGRSRRNLLWDWLILVVRDIETATPSVMLENEYALPSYSFRRKHILKKVGVDLDDTKDAMSKAILSIVYWSRIILAQSPDFKFRIEDQQERFRDFLVESKIAMPEASATRVNEKENAGKRYGGMAREKPQIAADAWAGLGSELKDHVAWYCAQFGYRDPIC